MVLPTAILNLILNKNSNTLFIIYKNSFRQYPYSYALFFHSELPVEKNLQRRFSSSKLLSKKPNLTTPAVSERKEEDVLDHDAFEHILQVTSDHEAIMAYYYMDENNKVRIFRTLDARIGFIVQKKTFV